MWGAMGRGLLLLAQVGPQFPCPRRAGGPERVVRAGMNAPVAGASERARARLSAAGARTTRLAVPEFAEFPALSAAPRPGGDPDRTTANPSSPPDAP